MIDVFTEAHMGGVGATFQIWLPINVGCGACMDWISYQPGVVFIRKKMDWSVSHYIFVWYVLNVVQVIK